MISIIIEGSVICLLFSIIMIQCTKNPLCSLYNLPMKIQERVLLLPEYADYSVKVIKTMERIIKKMPALIILMFLFLALIYLNSARSFYDCFIYTFVL